MFLSQIHNMFAQGLGHRNLILMAVILNSYISKERDISFRLMTIEEPEAHLCCSNIQLMISLISIFGRKNSYTQIVYSTHNAEFVNKLGIDNVIVFHSGEAFNLSNELTDKERDYLSANPNTDIFKLLYSRKTILVEGITEELLIKSYLQMRNDLSEIKVLSFHKGFTRIIDIWKKINGGTKSRLGIVRDYDEQLKAQAAHEKKQDEQICVKTTQGYTLETDIVSKNYELLKEKYGKEYGWSTMTEDEIQRDWRDNKKSDVMLRICHDMSAISARKEENFIRTVRKQLTNVLKHYAMRYSVQCRKSGEKKQQKLRLNVRRILLQRKCWKTTIKQGTRQFQYYNGQKTTHLID